MKDDDYKIKKMRNIKIFIILGLGLILVSNLLGFLGIKIGKDDFWLDMFNMWGLILVIGTLAKYILIKRHPNWEKINKIAEYDERNVFIRGKAAYSSFIISSMGLAIIDVILVYLDYIIPVYLVTAILFIQYLSLLGFTQYYGKKI